MTTTAPATRNAVLELGYARSARDPFGNYVDCLVPKRTLAEGLTTGVIQIKDDEQRGIDPVSGKEVLNTRKMKEWLEKESDPNGRVFFGQLVYAINMEAGASVEVDGDTLYVWHGPVLMADGRQRSYTIRDAYDMWKSGGLPNWDPDELISVRVYLNANSETRKEIFAWLNGGRGGDHANESTSEWMAPESPYQEAAKALVERSPHLTLNNVNHRSNKAGRNDPRLTGFHTIVRAVEAGWKGAWGKGRMPDAQEWKDWVTYLVDFWDALVDARPELGLQSLPDRQKAREEFITSHPLFIYGAMAVARQLWELDPANPPLERLEALADMDDTFAMNDGDDPNPVWVDAGILVPRRDRHTGAIKGWSVRTAFQTRKAMAEVMVEEMFSEAELN